MNKLKGLSCNLIYGPMSIRVQRGPPRPGQRRGLRELGRLAKVVEQLDAQLAAEAEEG